MSIMIFSFVAGAAGWAASEYLLHRFVGHQPKSRTQFAREHRRHHAEGDYFAPTLKKAQAMGPVVILIGLFGGLVLGGSGVFFAIGFAVAYAGYEIFHRRLHTHPPTNRYGRWARKHHFHHHFHDPKMNHGVTSPVGDWIFSTETRPARIRVPERLAMRWLVDPETNDVREAFAEDYQLVRLPQSRAER